MENIAKTTKTRGNTFLLAILLVLAGLLGTETANAQWWKDTVWTRETDQKDGFYMLKFSKNDSILVGHGYQMDLFFDAKNGREIIRIPGNNEVFYINNNKSFVRLREDNSKLEIFDATTYQVVDSIENDGIQIGSIDISKDERYIVGVITNGIRIWDLQTKRILRTKFFPDEENLISIGIRRLHFLPNYKIIGQFAKSYQIVNDPNHTINIGYFGVWDFNTLDSIDAYKNGQDFTISNTYKYIAYKSNQTSTGVAIYDLNTKELLWDVPTNGPSLTGLEFSPDDKYLVTASNNNSYGMNIWDITNKKLNFHYNNGAGYSNIDISNNGKFIIFSIVNGLYLFKSYFSDVSVPDPLDSQTILYPNPTNGQVTVTFTLTTPQVLNYSIYSEDGKLLKPLLNELTEAGAVSKSFDVTDLNSGNYFLKIVGQNLNLTFKLIIIK